MASTIQIFLLTTTQGKFILTLFESLSPEQLTDYLNLLVFLDKNHIPCPAPFTNNQSEFQDLLHNKPAALFK